jgi:hypothetical protein
VCTAPGLAACPDRRQHDADDCDEIIREENIGAIEYGSVCADEDNLRNVENYGEDKVPEGDDTEATQAADERFAIYNPSRRPCSAEEP